MNIRKRGIDSKVYKETSFQNFFLLVVPIWLCAGWQNLLKIAGNCYRKIDFRQPEIPLIHTENGYTHESSMGSKELKKKLKGNTAFEMNHYDMQL